MTIIILNKQKDSESGSRDYTKRKKVSNNASQSSKSETLISNVERKNEMDPILLGMKTH